jgi:3-mercaptopyruvate sulfurtransferase SseA
LYDGSLQDWSRRTDLAVEGGVPATRGAPISAEELAARLERHEVTIVHLRSDLNAYLASHLPGAVYLHYETLRAAQAGVPGDVLSAAGYAAIWGRIGMRQDRPAYAVQGITPDKQVILYCNTGNEASHAYFALRFLLEYPHVSVYVPSWTEWAERTEWAVDGPGAAAAGQEAGKTP